MTGLPRKSSRLTIDPSTACSVNSGAEEVSSDLVQAATKADDIRISPAASSVYHLYLIITESSAQLFYITKY
jgi:hypothetical protein